MGSGRPRVRSREDTLAEAAPGRARSRRSTDGPGPLEPPSRPSRRLRLGNNTPALGAVARRFPHTPGGMERKREGPTTPIAGVAA